MVSGLGEVEEVWRGVGYKVATVVLNVVPCMSVSLGTTLIYGIWCDGRESPFPTKWVGGWHVTHIEVKLVIG